MNLYGKHKLSPNEVRCCDLLLQGLTIREISKIMFVQVKTTYTHKARAFTKLGVRNVAELSRLRVQSMLDESPMTMVHQRWRAGYRSALEQVLQP